MKALLRPRSCRVDRFPWSSVSNSESLKKRVPSQFRTITRFLGKSHDDKDQVPGAQAHPTLGKETGTACRSQWLLVQHGSTTVLVSTASSHLTNRTYTFSFGQDAFHLLSSYAFLFLRCFKETQRALVPTPCAALVHMILHSA